MKNKSVLWAMLGLSVVGILDSFYLTIIHFSQNELVCTIIEGCDVVLKSAYSEIGPISTAALGVLFYITVFYIVLLYISGKTSDVLMNKLVWVFALGFAASLFFLYLQMFVIKAYCQYCILSLITSTLLFVLFFFKEKSKNKYES
ncbi:hypothetical protein COW81_00990 [Candidatus Campbellbacteria bacterium CG22_combo_CG10-13_8_21_14_all_36_13]|uniref:Vitamin K epoxide reductase domain-containing protein n=1 Tax=Candidatus Campbellbacteria bacterium CG22_combo_CG10-13_8_21_14_all_36_13 TaxID=1974529 RepID=A0A2H0DZH9_9BACT|nr:MAG: hypothetical protein COW81_00990 [Candidatus Campbellbacteria bacterium CG22_combo_CG10-13_8_21_14_all_36_13]